MPNHRPSESPATRTLLEGAKTGDLASLNALYGRFRGPLSRWVRGRLPGHAREVLDTDDLVQDAMLRSLSHLQAFEQERDKGFLRYLQTSVMNGVRQEIRRIRRRPRRGELPEEFESPQLSPLEELVSSEQLERYHRGLDQLSAEEQDLIVSRLELELSFQDIAIHLQRPSADAARVAFNRALAKLADHIAEAEGSA